jgi:hypothetical protein
MVGRTKMKDWKAALANWSKDKRDTGSNGYKQPNQSSTRKHPSQWVEEMMQEANETQNKNQISDAEVVG